MSNSPIEMDQSDEGDFNPDTNRRQARSIDDNYKQKVQRYVCSEQHAKMEREMEEAMKREEMREYREYSVPMLSEPVPRTVINPYFAGRLLRRKTTPPAESFHHSPPQSRIPTTIPSPTSKSETEVKVARPMKIAIGKLELPETEVHPNNILPSKMEIGEDTEDLVELYSNSKTTSENQPEFQSRKILTPKSRLHLRRLGHGELDEETNSGVTSKLFPLLAIRGTEPILPPRDPEEPLVYSNSKTISENQPKFQGRKILTPKSRLHLRRLGLAELDEETNSGVTSKLFPLLAIRGTEPKVRAGYNIDEEIDLLCKAMERLTINDDPVKPHRALRPLIFADLEYNTLIL